MRRHAPRGLKPSDVTRIPLRHGHPPHDARMEFQRSSEPRQAARERGRRLGPARAAGSRRGALAMGWRDWAGVVAPAIYTPHPPDGRFGLTLRGHNSGPFYRQELKF